MTRTWATGTTEVAPGAFAYVQATGGLCIANAGIMGELVTNVVQKGMSPADSMKAGQERATKVANDAKAGIKKA